MAYNNPSTADFKTMFARDFPYSVDAAVGVTDADIGSAFVDTNMQVNPELFGDQASYTRAYLLMAAHCLVSNMRMSSSGLSSGAFAFLEQSKSVGAIAQSFAIPQRVLDNPEFAMLCATQYGAKYLALVLPLLSGQMFGVCGTTQSR